MTAPEPVPLPDGEMMAATGELLFADEMRADAVAGYSFQRDGEQLLVMLTFAGRLNRSTDRKQYTVAMHPEDADQFAVGLLAAVVATERRAAETGSRR